MADLLGGYMPSLGKSLEQAMNLKYMQTRQKLAESELADAPMKRQERLYDLTMNHLKSVTDKDDYKDYYDYMQKFNADFLPPPSEFQDQPDEYFQEWKMRQLHADEYVKAYFSSKSEKEKQKNRIALENLEQENREALSKLKAQLEEPYKETPEEREAKKKIMLYHPEEGVERDVTQGEAERLLGADIGWQREKPADWGKRPPAAETWLLPDKTRVRSFTGGRTYVSDTGEEVPMPPNASRIDVRLTGEDLSMMEAQRAAEAELTEEVAQRTSAQMEEAARSGTGPYAMLKASVDRLLGGLGADLLFGKEGFFQDTQENRQALRLLNTLARDALRRGARPSVWIDKRLKDLLPDPDRMFTNPRTEAKKFRTLRSTLLEERRFNNEAISTATTNEEVSKLRAANTEIDRLLSLIGGEEITPRRPTPTLSDEDRALIDKWRTE